MALKHMQEYLKNETPEQKKARCLKMREAKRIKREQRLLAVSGTGAKNAPGDFVGIRINICHMNNGDYVKGTSRTILVSTSSFNGTTDEMRDELAHALKQIKSTKKVRSRVLVV